MEVSEATEMIRNEQSRYTRGANSVQKFLCYIVYYCW